MSTPTRLLAFAALLAAIFAGAAVAGAEIEPEVDEPASPHEEESEMTSTHAATNTHATGALPGLAVAEGEYRLVPDETTIQPGAAQIFRFRIVAEDGETVEEFEVEHERRMHLIVVRRDFAGFQHLHPRQAEDGSWKAELDIREGGAYRAFADFATGGTSLTLAADLFVPGNFDPMPLAPPSARADAGGGYEVTLDSAEPSAGGVTDARFTVSRNGRPVDSVEPYLGADGHLVALREHDQAFLHTHPEGEAGGSGPIQFGVEYPRAGRYRLFLEFKHGGEVRTAAFTQEVRDGGH